MIRSLIAWLLKSATFKLYTATEPIGRRLGGADQLHIPDAYIILDVRVSGQIVLLGYFQTS